METQIQSITVDQDSVKSILNVFFKTIVRSLTFPVRIFPDITMPDEKKENLLINSSWDTGASSTHITKSAALKLGLITRKEFSLCNKKGFNLDSKIVPVTLLFPDKRVQLVGAYIADDFPDADLIIGMDIINTGNFQYRVKNGKSVLSIARALNDIEKPEYSKDHHPDLISCEIDRFGCFQMKVEYPGIVDRLIIPVIISSFHIPIYQPGKEQIKVNCIIDTGAPISLITSRLAEKLNLTRIDGKDQVIKSGTAKDGDISVIFCQFMEYYDIEIVVQVKDDDHPDYDFILGMDLISSGSLGIINFNNQTTLLLTLSSNT